MDRGGNDVGLREIGDCGTEREQADPSGHAEEIRRAYQFGQSCEGAAANTLPSKLHFPWRIRHAFNSMHAEDSYFEESCGHDKQVDRTERRRQPDRNKRTEKRPSRSPGADEPEQPLALL